MVRYLIYVIFFWNVGIFMLAQGVGPLVRAPQSIYYNLFASKKLVKNTSRAALVPREANSPKEIKAIVKDQNDKIKWQVEQNRENNRLMQERIRNQRFTQAKLRERTRSNDLKAQRDRARQSQYSAQTRSQYRDLINSRKNSR